MSAETQRSVIVDISELNRYRTKLGWSMERLANKSQVSTRTIERLYRHGTVSRQTYVSILNAIQDGIREAFDVESPPIKLILPSERELGHSDHKAEIRVTIEANVCQFSDEKVAGLFETIRKVQELGGEVVIMKAREG